MQTAQIKPRMYRSKNEYLALFVSFFFGFVFLFLLDQLLNFWLIVFLVALAVSKTRAQQTRYLGNAMRVHKNQFPELYELFVQQAKKLGVDKANLYIIQDPYLNANTIGLGTCSVVLNSALVEQLSTKELAFVIAHELGHYAAGHTKISSILIPIGNNNTITNVIFGLWQRQAEYTADRCGLIVNQDLDSAITAIIKFTVGGKLFEKVSLKGYFTQIKKADTFSTSVTAFSLNRPLITSRVKKIIAFWKENFTNKTTKEYQTN